MIDDTPEDHPSAFILPAEGEPNPIEPDDIKSALDAWDPNAMGEPGSAPLERGLKHIEVVARQRPHSLPQEGKRARRGLPPPPPAPRLLPLALTSDATRPRKQRRPTQPHASVFKRDATHTRTGVRPRRHSEDAEGVAGAGWSASRECQF